MGFELYIPPCVNNLAHPLHHLPLEKPLRIQIEGPLVAIQKLMPSASWHTDPLNPVFPQSSTHGLAKLTYRVLYGQDIRPEVVGDLTVRDEYLGWVMGDRPLDIDCYGVTFDHLVPAEIVDPDVLQINIIELEANDGPFADGVAYANECLLFTIDPAEYVRKKVLAVPRCRQKRKGTQDRKRINDRVTERDSEVKRLKSGSKYPSSPKSN